MILWLFALFDFFIGLILIASHFDFVPWRITVVAAISLASKAIVFNDKFLSAIDILAAIYLFVLVFIEGSSLTWLFAMWFGYKILVSMF